MTAKGQKKAVYTEEMITEFLEIAQVEGLTRTIKEFGYPTYNTALRWAKTRGIDTSTSTLMEQARKAHRFYETEDLVQAADEILTSILDDIRLKDLDADAKNKLANAFTKVAATWQVLQGKASSINESRSGSEVDNHINELINQFKTNEADTTSSSDSSI